MGLLSAEREGHADLPGPTSAALSSIEEYMEEITIPDEAKNSQAYRDALLAVSGNGNPIEILSSTHARMIKLTLGLNLETLHMASAPGEWSAQEQMQHVLDAEMAYAFRWRLMLTEDRPAYPSYDVKRWVDLPKAPF